MRFIPALKALYRVINFNDRELKMDGLFTNTDSLKSKHKSVEWYTPKWVFDALGLAFDLDPSSPHDMESQVPAIKKYTLFDDGLKKPWEGTVWLNPPYGKDTPLWIKRFVDHGDGIALVFSRTDTEWCQLAMNQCNSMLFLGGRIEFIPGIENKHKKSRCGAGTVMFAFGDKCELALRKLSDRGIYIQM